MLGQDPVAADLFTLEPGGAPTSPSASRRPSGTCAGPSCACAQARNYIEIVRNTQRNVKRWQDGDMRKRWTAAGMLQAQAQFRRIVGYTDLAKLVTAIERHSLDNTNPTNAQRPSTEPAAELFTV
jgi:hypothetical protein